MRTVAFITEPNVNRRILAYIVAKDANGQGRPGAAHVHQPAT